MLRPSVKAALEHSSLNIINIQTLVLVRKTLQEKGKIARAPTTFFLKGKGGLTQRMFVNDFSRADVKIQVHKTNFPHPYLFTHKQTHKSILKS